MTKVATDTLETPALVGSCPRSACRVDLIYQMRHWSEAYHSSLKANMDSAKKVPLEAISRPVLPWTQC